MGNKKQLIIYFIISLISSFIGAFIALLFIPTMLSNTIKPAKINIIKTQKIIEYKAGDKDTIVNAVKIAGPSVVNIDTVSQTKGLFGSGIDELLKQFLGKDFFNKIPSFPMKGMGSGIIIDKKGYVLTNYHVVKNAKDITVTLPDNQKKYKAQLIGYDETTDLAVLKINAKDLPAAKIGNSDDIAIGEWVIAIGNPYGFSHTVTVGVLSARDRTIPIGHKNYEDLLQTDAAINPGNSGGALINLKGEVIGVNTAIIKGAQGIGFAIPINRAMQIAKSLIKYKKVVRPYLGVKIQSITSQIRQWLGIKRSYGVVVIKVMPNSPAEKSNISMGDVILSIDGKKLYNPSDLVKEIRKHKVGDKIDLLILRPSFPIPKHFIITLEKSP